MPPRAVYVSARKRRLRRTQSTAVAFLRSRIFLGGLIVVVALALLVAHGSPGWGFNVDWISLALLGIAALPYLSRTLISLKAGQVEISFRDLPEHDQLLVFLDGVAAKQRWTFFAPRSEESHLGGAFKVLTEELVSRARARMVEQLRLWLAADEGQRWFAAEIIGYHRMLELRQAVRNAPLSKELDAEWEPWELNCVWAYSRLDTRPYSSLVAFFRETRNEANQDWILKSFDQMLESGLEPRSIFEPIVAELTQALKQHGVNEDAARARFEALPSLRLLVQSAA